MSILSFFLQKIFVLPCIRLNLPSRLSQNIFVGAYFKKFKEDQYELIYLQGAKYIFKGDSYLY